MTDAQTLTMSLGGKWYQSYGTAPCPICQPEGRKDQTALGLANGNEGRLLLKCRKNGCDFRAILGSLGMGAGEYRPPHPEETIQQNLEIKAEAARKERQAASCWSQAQALKGTVAETYLRGRGITCPLPETLRFHPDCWYGPTAKRHPALIAWVEGGNGIAIHRTYVRVDGSEKAPLNPAKAMLGAVAGGAVRLSQAGEELVVAEGIETALSLASGLISRPATIWATLSTSGMRGLRLPSKAGKLTIASDGDAAGRVAAYSLAERAHAAGWAVSLLPAPNGRDWNDVLALRGNIK